MKLKIRCPECNTTYEIPSEKIGGEGRTVKCTRCSTSWRARADDADTIALNEKKADAEWQQLDRESAQAAPSPTPQDPAPSTTETAEQASADQSAATAENEADAEPNEGAEEETASGADSPEEAGENDDAVSAEAAAAKATKARDRVRSRYAHLAKKRLGASPRARRIMGGALFAASLLVCAMTLVYRDTFVRQFPDLAGLYQLAGLTVNLRGLEFRDLRTFREVEDGTTVLVVEGAIENITDKRVGIPAVRLSLRSHDRHELYAWTVEPRLMTLDPATKTRFRTRLAQPPDRAADIQMRFVERQQRRASTR